MKPSRVQVHQLSLPTLIYFVIVPFPQYSNNFYNKWLKLISLCSTYMYKDHLPNQANGKLPPVYDLHPMEDRINE